MKSLTPALALLLEVAVALAPTVPSIAHAQAPSEMAVAPPGTESPEALVKSLYAVISGAAGAPRDWARFRALCLPDARLVATHVMPDGTTRVRSFSVEQYVEGGAKGFAREGFYETGAVKDLHRFDRTVTVVSPYESRHAAGEKPFARGVNHFQLFNDGRRWWVVDIFWEDESPSAPLPPAMAKQLQR